jgi:hypothetical protein
VRTKGILAVCAAALSLPACHTYPSGSPEALDSPCSPRGYVTVAFEELVVNMQRYEAQNVAVDGYVVPSGSGCDHDPCDVRCTLDAKLAATPDSQDPKKAFFLVSATGTGFGHCSPDSSCKLVCDPPAGVALRVLGTFGAATKKPGEGFISVDRYCELEG